MAQPLVKIKQTAQLIGDATIKGDYVTVLNYTYPKAIALAGGRDTLLGTMKRVFAELSTQGIAFKSVEIGTPGDIIEAGGKSFSLIPQTLVMKMNGGTITAKSSTLAISSDKGAHWFFVGSGSMKDEALYALFPELKDKMMFPKFGQPIFVPDPK